VGGGVERNTQWFGVKDQLDEVLPLPLDFPERRLFNESDLFKKR